MSMLHEISPLSPRYKKGQRKGRGESSGRGKTSGRGNKGSKARTGKYVKIGHEHGQTPIYRRLPKRGFSNHDFERRFHVVNLQDLDVFDDGAIVDAEALIEKGLVPDRKWPVKILGDGEITKKLTIVAGRYSKSAHEKIAAAGGTTQNLKGETYAFPKVKRRFPKPIGNAGGKKAAKPAAEEAAPAGDAPAAAPAPAAGGEQPA